MSMTPSCGLGHNGGPPLDDLEPLAAICSLTINDASKRTGLSRSRIYRFLDAGRLRSFKVGKARLIIGQSLRQLLTELAANPEGAPPLPPRQGHRFAPSRTAHDADLTAALTESAAPLHGQAPRRIARPISPNKNAAPSGNEGDGAEDIVGSYDIKGKPPRCRRDM